MKRQPTARSLTRRRFLALSGLGSALYVLNGCATSGQPTPTQQPKQAPTSPPVPSVAASAPTSQPTQAAAAPTKAAGPKSGGTFTLAQALSIQTFNPLQIVPANFAHMRALHSTLVRYDEQLSPQPDLAEKWTLAADGKSISLNLRRGVKFHTGREFTAEDVRYTLQYAQSNEVVTMRSLFRTVKALETPDPYTVVLQFANANPGVFDLLDMLFIIDKETFGDGAKPPAGTGPFKAGKYVPNDSVEFDAFKDYWDKGKPYASRYVIRQVPDLSTMVINLESGAVDCVFQPNFLDIARLKKSGKFVADLGAPGTGIFELAINTKVKPLDNRKVRQAIAWCIDRKRFCTTTLQGLVEPSCLMWPSNSWAYFKDLEGKIGYDLDKARALLKEAGAEAGFETEIMTSSKNFGFGELAQIIQADLKKVNISAKIVDLEQAQFQSRIQSRDVVMTIHSYGRANRDPGSLVTGAVAWYSTREGTFTNFESATYDQLRNDLTSSTDLEKRKVTARKIQELALDECFVNPVASNQRAFAYAGYVKNFHCTQDNSPYVGDIWLDK
ncbi:MAG: ABC transporter substrate-binding protein [Chloroflexi bacterium]|nr:ABC transporter substrate-binding protein [Chloroflexota bacterium]MCL5110574.1 ABC transporter substrate-binding protein [Chloroflexota bacterium]